MNGLRLFLRTARFLSKSTWKEGMKANQNSIQPAPKETQHNIKYDLYEPKKTAQKTFVVIHGLTLQGHKDQRLVHFSRTLADFGVRVAAISLPAITECRFEEKDVEAISELVTELADLYDSNIGIIAFSFGAGFALVAASKKEMQDIIDPLVLFGAYYNLSDVFDSIINKSKKKPLNDEEWNNYIWFKLVFAFRNLNELPVDSDTKESLKQFLTHYCHESSIGTKRSFYDNVLKNLNYSELEKKIFDSESFKTISPENNLSSIKSRVMLLHDYHDELIDSDHSKRIFQEMTMAGNFNDHQLLITPLLSHVTSGSFKISDLFRLIKMMSVVFE